MSNENKSIHEFDFNLICEYFASVERQGPGSREVTLKALSFIDNLNWLWHRNPNNYFGSAYTRTNCGFGSISQFYQYFRAEYSKTRSPRPGERNSWLYGQSPIRKRRVRFDMVGRSYLQYRFSAWTAYMEGISEKRRLCCRFRSFLVHQQTSCGN